MISDKTISRKHLTISVDRVRDGDGRDPGSRSVVTIEDLATKIGTVVNGTQIRGQKFVLIQDDNDVKMGHMPDLFRIAWHPVVFSFSFSSKELRALPDPWQQLKKDLEPLDIKYISEFDRARTTHVVAKKRNTSKGLQALINSDYIVTEAYIAAIATAASSSGAGEPGLESDFGKAWPSPLDYLPPRGDEPSDRPVSTYSPDARRANIFEGYTFVFYDQKQFDTLLPPIAEGRGKALLGTVVPGHTEVDDFVRYVKGVAGEKGLGEFEDGSEGRGVVVVRHVPAKGDHVAWFTRFTTAVALRLDHRLIDQREFLDAVLAVDPRMLRRPLEVDVAGDQPAPRRTLTQGSASATRPAGGMDGGEPVSPSADADEELVQRPPPPSQSLSQASSTRRARARRGGAASRFKGFDVDLDSGDEDGTAAGTGAAPVKRPDDEKGDMFMSQPLAVDEAPDTQQPRGNKRHPPDDEDMDDAGGMNNVMDDIAPTAALVKRRRIEAGIDPVPARESPSQEDGDDDKDEDEDEKDKNAKRNKGAAKTAVKKEKLEGADDILAKARRNREAADEKRRLDAERERLAAADMPDDGIDAAAVRKLTLVETIQVREAGSAARTREQDIADGRWNPQWNGRRNYKKFRKQGDVVGRVPQRVIVGLEPAKTKEYGLGDDYWLEGGDDEGAWRGSGSHNNSNANGSNGRAGRNAVPTGPSSRLSGTPSGRVVDADDLDDTSMAGHDDPEPSEPGDVPAPRRAAVASTPSMPATNPAGSVRRPAPATLASGSLPVSVSAAGLGSGSGSGGGESLGSGMVNLEIIPDTEPEDEHHGVASDDDDDDDPSLSAGTRGARDSLAVSQMSDLPRTRAGKAASRPARQSQNQSQPPAAKTTRTSRRGALPPSGDTGSSLFDSVQAPSTQVSDLRATRAKRTAPAPSTRLQSPAKRPRRGAAADVDTAASPVAISDSDDDDGLRFKFKSRR